MRKIAVAFISRCQVRCVTDKKTISVRHLLYPNNGLAKCELVKTTSIQEHRIWERKRSRPLFLDTFHHTAPFQHYSYSTEELIHA